MTQTVRSTLNNIKELLLNEQTEILKAAGLLMLPSILTKITGQLFNLLAASRLPLESKALNEFLLASAFPEMVANILLLGVISAVVIPIFVEVKEKHGRERFLRVYNTIFNISVLAFVAATILVVVFADRIFPFFLVNVIRPEVMPDASSIANIVSMMQFLMLPMLILGVSVFVTSGLNVYQRFFVPQLAPLFYNVGRIFGVFVLIPVLHESPWGFVLGTLIGSILHLLIQIPLARYLKISYIPVIDLHDVYARKMFQVSLPRSISLAAEQVVITVQEFIAGGFSKISLPAFYFAESLALVIPTLFGYTFSVASFPLLSSLYTQGRHQEVGELVTKTLNQILFLSLPFVVAAMILRLPVVRLVYGVLPDTEFNRESSAAVAWILLLFSFGLVFTAMKWYLYRVFYITKNTLVPMVISISSMIITIVVGVMFSNLFSYADGYTVKGLEFSFSHLFTRAESAGPATAGGLALGTSLGAILEVSIMLVLINIMVVKVNWQEMFVGFSKKLIASSAMIVLMYFMYKTWDTLAFPIDATPGFKGSTTINLLVLTSITVFTSFMVYYLLCFLFKVEELKILRRFLNPVFKIGGLKI